MELSKQLIEILEYLGEKIGLSVNWSTENVIPYAKDLCGKYIKWEMVTLIFYIIVALIFIIVGIFMIRYVINKFKNGEIQEDTEQMICIVIAVVSICIIIIPAIEITFEIQDIIKCCTFPEMQLYEYISKLVNK